MNPNTGEIRFDTADKIEEWQRGENFRAIPLTGEQAHRLLHQPATARKNYMRNWPCPCGAGRKFKKCCWSKYK